ncbi:MAG: CBS domain-containing protein [Candidatus Bathyarchaeota archaeon]|nr:CBS domain-containing protein [Candidatus Bathyarchaeota archaeon]MDH5494960.1 CBS domain-containing protein [Candidatus Bathyarchaeota archaeon]
MEGRKPPSTVRSVMAKPVITIKKNSSVREAAEIMSKKGVGSIVVNSEGKPVGIVTERDIVERVVARGLDASKVQMKEIMSKSLITTKGEMPIIEAIRMMQKKKIRRLLIMENKKLVGIVTQRDLLRALAFHVLISFRPLLETG